MSEARSSRISRNTNFSIARILAIDDCSEHTAKSVTLNSIESQSPNFQEANRERNMRQDAQWEQLKLTAGETLKHDLREREINKKVIPRSNQEEKREEYLDSCIEFSNDKTCSVSSVTGSQRQDYNTVWTSDLTWLQYTRYKPPKLPRRSFVERRRKRRAGEHPRIPFSSSQLQVLEDRFKKGAYLSRNDVVEMSTMLRLPQNKIKVWFQNRRARQRRESLNSTLPTR